MKRTVCPTHGVMPVAYQVGSPLAAILGGVALANQLAKGNPIVMVAGGLAGLLFGAEIAKHCPQCGQLLQIVEVLDRLGG